MKPLIMAHRGGDYFGIENSLETLNKTLKYTPDIIEIDVRKSSDNILFCFHGSNFQNLFGKLHFKKPIKKLQKKYPSISTLREIIKYIGRKAEIYLDIKDTSITSEDLKKVFKGLKTKQVYIACFRLKFLQKIKVPKTWKKCLHLVLKFNPNIKKLLKADIKIIQFFFWNLTNKNIKKLNKYNIEYSLAHYFLTEKKFIELTHKKKAYLVWIYDLPKLIKYKKIMGRRRFS